jgi:integrase/recombinase XerD
MNFAINLYLDTRKAKRDGTFPLVFRVYKSRESYISLSTGLCLLEKDWDVNKKAIKSTFKGSKSVAWLNNYITSQKAFYGDILAKLDYDNRLTGLSYAELKELLVKKSAETTFCEYTRKLATEMRQLKRIGNARSYDGIIQVLTKYLKGKDIKFEELSYSFLNKFELAYLSKEGNSKNGLAVYMRTIRAIYNRAIKDGLIGQEHYPFSLYKIKTEPTQKRAIDFQSLKAIELLEFQENDTLFHARNYFLLSFYLMGISYTDLAHLTRKDITDGRISFSRQKTSRKYDMAITDKAKTILDYYLQKFPKSEYILPIISESDPSKQYKQIHESRKRFNMRLKKIAELCGIEKNLTSYVSRHSFATLAKNKGIPIAAISEMLGHESVKTTQVYLDSLPSDLIDKYHRDILGD